jgi:hypothetical protein
MEYKKFLKFILAHKRFNDDIHDLYTIGFDLMEGKYNLTKPVNEIFETTILSHYDKNGLDWVEWFIYKFEYGEKVWKTKEGHAVLVDVDKNDGYGTHDENGNPICYDYKSLWEYLEKECIKKIDK